MSRLCLYYIQEPETDRWIYGDRFIRPSIRRVLRGRGRPSGIDKVFMNLRLGLDKLKIEYQVNLPFSQLTKGDRVGVLGRGRRCLEGYDQSNKIVAGIGLMTHPSEWETLCDDYPVVKYLQHSDWANEVYKPYFGERCDVWPVGIDTDYWQPALGTSKTTDFLIYDKIHWSHDKYNTELITPIKNYLIRRKLSFVELRYGTYKSAEFKAALDRCRAMLFFCEHESQGIAYQECLASGVPIIAWDQGRWLDPNRFRWGTPNMRATSVPYWDERCGVKFTDIYDFPARAAEFLERLDCGQFSPRAYIMDNLTAEMCAKRFLNLYDEVIHK